MPELPEVQTVLDTLSRQIKNREIVKIEILYKPIVDCDEKVFKKKLINEHFRNFKRRGKYLLFEMDDITLVSHLRMEGKYFILDKNVPLSKHDHVIFFLDNGKQLRYNDVRKFGRMELMEKQDDYHIFKNLGPEPFGKYFDFKYCKQYLCDNKLPIKQILLDQSFIAGIGNIYADEILYEMKVNPKTLGCHINDEEIHSLIKATRTILKKAIKQGGTTIRSYTSSLGVTGRFQQELQVHTKDICPVCKNDIRKIVVGTRGTYYCPNCQKPRISIAITGSIGSGKSEASNYLRKKGYYVFDCDKVNNDLLKYGKEGYLAIKKLFPKCFDGKKLNKEALSKIVFSSVKEKKVLENAMHPLILAKMMEEKAKHDLFFAEVPLLFEAKWDKYFDKSLLIVSDQKTALKRLKNRGLTLSQAKKRLENQMPVEEKMSRASQIIYNNGSLDEFYQSIDSFVKEIC